MPREINAIVTDAPGVSGLGNKAVGQESVDARYITELESPRGRPVKKKRDHAGFKLDLSA